MSFGGLRLTNKGREELAKAEFGEPLVFDYMAIGDGDCASSTLSLESLANELYQLPILSVTRDKDNIIVEADLSNDNLQESFYFREIGLYVNGVLYAYDNAGQEAEYIDAAGSAVAKQKRIRVILTVTSDASVTVKTDPGLYALQKDLAISNSKIEDLEEKGKDCAQKSEDACTRANNAYNQANNAYTQANSAYTKANDAYNTANSAYAQANSAYTKANNAYNAANNAAAKLKGTVVAIGGFANASGNYSTALGYYAKASGNDSTALGSYASANTINSTALGSSANASGNYSTALGDRTNANGSYSTALGYAAKANGNYSTALGSSANASGINSTALGYLASANAINSTALGSYASASGNYSIAIGNSASASGNYSIAIGNFASASGNYSTALGDCAKVGTTKSYTIQLGNASSLSELSCRVALTVTSDERDKTDITGIENGAVEFLKKVKAIRYKLNHRELYIDEENLSDEERLKRDKYGLCEYDREAHAKGTKKGSRIRVGVSAQETQKALEEVYGSASYANLINDNLFDFSPDEIPEGVENQLSANYEGFIPFLIKAVQELAARLEHVEIQKKGGEAE